ncbi:MAG: DUF4296 domain-containing protein [Prevotella sp.]|nr:DUF4296 domain-containing protein [Prevotella sp.]
MTSLIVVFYSCKPSVPGKYIQPGEMEDLLYDYHIADGMAQEVRDDGMGARQIAFRAAVLKKHGVTQADFDSSMIYYMRHADRLHAIYQNISRRLSDEAMIQGATASEVNRFGALAANGDTADIWAGEKSIVLMPQVPYNESSFAFTTDSAFHKGDEILLTFKTDFIYQDGMRDGIAVLAVRFNNDSVASQMLHLSSSTRFNLQINDPSRSGIKEIKGFFMLNKSNFEGRSNTTVQLMFIHHIQLIRMHEKRNKPKEGAGKDSLQVDSATLRVDSGRIRKAPLNRPLRISP